MAKPSMGLSWAVPLGVCMDLCPGRGRNQELEKGRGMLRGCPSVCSAPGPGRWETAPGCAEARGLARPAGAAERAVLCRGSGVCCAVPCHAVLCCVMLCHTVPCQ